jgi:hypothetical protein
VKEVHIFSLEGAVKAGMMPKLLTYKYDSTVAYNQKSIEYAIAVRKKVKLISSILSYPTLFLATILLVIFLLILTLRFLIKKVFKLVIGNK